VVVVTGVVLVVRNVGGTNPPSMLVFSLSSLDDGSLLSLDDGSLSSLSSPLALLCSSSFRSFSFASVVKGGGRVDSVSLVAVVAASVDAAGSVATGEGEEGDGIDASTDGAGASPNEAVSDGGGGGGGGGAIVSVVVAIVGGDDVVVVVVEVVVAVVDVAAASDGDVGFGDAALSTFMVPILIDSNALVDVFDHKATDVVVGSVEADESSAVAILDYA